MNTELQIHGGILIIGSLLWQDHLNLKKKDGLRKLWREQRLIEKQKLLVKVPIRYGRLSQSNIYTMTFSNVCAKEKNGTGYFIPFQKKLFKINDILKEAEEISIAEGMDGNFIAKNGAGQVWCVLGILFNPKLDLKIKNEILGSWKSLLEKEGGFSPKDFRLGHEAPCLNESGEFDIKWPATIDEREQKIFDRNDFIIATATRPTKPYPTIGELVKKINSDKSRFYFIENFKSGIMTFQDNQIMNKLS